MNNQELHQVLVEPVGYDPARSFLALVRSLTTILNSDRSTPSGPYLISQIHSVQMTWINY
jgi:hypothetical protein